MRRLLTIAAVMGAALVVASTLAAPAFAKQTFILVPDVIGMTGTQGQAAFLAAGFEKVPHVKGDLAGIIYKLTPKPDKYMTDNYQPNLWTNDVPTPTPTCTDTPTPTPTPTCTDTPSPTPTPSDSGTPSPSPTPSESGSPSPTPTVSPTVTPTVTPTPTVAPTDKPVVKQPPKGQLMFTGSNLPLVLAAGAGIILAGLVLRRRYF